MTHQEKEILLDAAELIAIGEREWSCHAILRASLLKFLRDHDTTYYRPGGYIEDAKAAQGLVRWYSAFYDKAEGDCWFPLDALQDTALNARILLLLLFREAAGEL